jgi:hypothetical protein
VHVENRTKRSQVFPTITHCLVKVQRLFIVPENGAQYNLGLSKSPTQAIQLISGTSIDPTYVQRDGVGSVCHILNSQASAI